MAFDPILEQAILNAISAANTAASNASTAASNASSASTNASTAASNASSAASGIGSTSDAASPTGSANAKLAALLTRLGNGTPNFYSVATNGAANVTLCNISGSGILLSLHVASVWQTVSGSTPGNSCTATITIDGTQQFNSSIAQTVNGYYPIGSGGFSGFVHFNSSLTILIGVPYTSQYMLVNALVLTGAV